MRSHLKAAARELRRNNTDAELSFWLQVRDRRFQGLKFRRQVPLGNYVVDFLCNERKLIVELDGGQHSEQETDDAARTAWLEAQGYRVVRFWNNDVMGDLDGVLTALHLALEESPSPRPSPASRERGRSPSP
jgi:very-short-patch-repair endonuclease